LSAFQRSAIRAACVDMHEPYRLSLEQWVPQCRLIYDKFHVMKHANEAVAEVRRAEFFRKGGAARELIKGKHWLLLTRWVHLNTNKKRQLNQLFALTLLQIVVQSRKNGQLVGHYDQKVPCCNGAFVLLRMDMLFVNSLGPDHQSSIKKRIRTHTARMGFAFVLN